MHYLIPIHNFFKGNGYTFMGNVELIMPPGYGILSFIAYLFIQFLPIDASLLIPLSGMLISFIFYLLSIPLTFLITRQIFNEKAAYISSFLVAFNYCFISISYVTLSDSCFIFFLLLSFYFTIRLYYKRSEKDQKIKEFLFYLALGFTLGFTYLIRPEGFIIFVFCIIILLIKKIKDHLKITKILSYMIGFLLSFSCLSLPYIFYIHEYTGLWTFSPKTTYNLLVGEGVVEGQDHVDRLKEEHPEYFNSSAHVNIFEYIQQRGEIFTKRILLNIISEISIIISILYYLGLIFVGFELFDLTFKIKNEKNRKNIIFNKKGIYSIILFLAFISPLFIYNLFFIAQRFILPYAILLIIILSQGIVKFSKIIDIYFKKIFSHIQFVKKKLKKNYPFFSKEKSRVIFLDMILTTSIFLPCILNFFDSITAQHGHLALMKSGIWIRENLDNIEEINFLFPRKGTVALFYAGGYEEKWGQAYMIPVDLKLENIAQYMINNSIDYLILENHYITTRKKFLSLWDSPNICESLNLKLIHLEEGVFQVYSFI